MADSYDALYRKLSPALAQLENKRLELKKKGTDAGLVAGGICTLIGIIITVWTGGNSLWFFVSLILGIIILIGCIHGQSKELSRYYKKDIIATLISSLCENSSFMPDRGISEQQFMGCGLFHTSPDRYSSEDMITGQVGKTAFACSEIVAEEKRVTTNSKGQRSEHWVDIFKGFFFIADFQKDFHGQTVVYRNSWLKLNFRNQRVKLENPEFEKKFDVYSTDQIEARYLLTPGMMEKLLELDRKFPGKITLSFYNSNVIIAIPDNTDHFEASIWSSQLRNNSLKQEYDTLSALIGIIDDLNLNVRIWTKE